MANSGEDIRDIQLEEHQHASTAKRAMLVDATGTAISTSNKLPVDATFTGTLEVNLDNANDDVLVYGNDGTTNRAIKTDASGELQVDVLTLPSIPTGTNSIGKLAANDGIDIGDVTVNNSTGASAVNIQDGGNSITVDGTVTSNQGTAHATEKWRVNVIDALPAGTNNIGDIDILTLPVDTYSVKSTDATTSGDITIHTPAAGKKIRLYYLCLNASGGNTADVATIVKFAAAGATKFKHSLKAGAIWARNIGAGRRYIEGAVNEALIVNLSATQTVHVSIEYEEI